MGSEEFGANMDAMNLASGEVLKPTLKVEDLQYIALPSRDGTTVFDTKDGEKILKIQNKLVGLLSEADGDSIVDHVFAQKSAVIENLFNDYDSVSPRLVQEFPKGLGDEFSALAPTDAYAVLKTKVEGRVVEDFMEPMSVVEVSGYMNNVLEQMIFVRENEDSLLKSVADLNQRLVELGEQPVERVGYHGDISSTAIVLNSETGVGAAIDWEGCFNELVEPEGNLHYAPPEVKKQTVTDEGKEPDWADFYSLGAVMTRMFLGKEDFDRCRAYRENDSISYVSRWKVKKALYKKGVPRQVRGMIHKLLNGVTDKTNPSDREIVKGASAIENLREMKRILSESAERSLKKKKRRNRAAHTE